MSTFYLDFENGNDSNDGTSFANRWKTIDSGATAARIAPGDTIRVMASPDPTSLGINGTWTDGPIGTAVNVSSSTNAVPIVVTAASGHGLVTGDTAAIVNHTTNTNANGTWKVTVSGNNITLLNADGTNSNGNGVGGSSGTIRKVTNGAVILASAVVANVALSGTPKVNWSASTNITCTNITTTYKEGSSCQQIDVGSSFTTGLAAWFSTGTLDLSGYQQLSFWIRQSAGTVGAANDLSIKLCSDTAGATPVNTFNIPALGGTLNQWTPITIDLGSNLGSSIKSVAFYVNTDNGVQTFQLDNIIACKASSNAASLSLTSLIGKNSGNETWWPIQSINNVRVMVDTNSTFNPTTSNYRGYAGASGTVTTYKRETIKRTMLAAPTTIASKFQDSGTSGNLITYSGGWDRTAMSSQSGQTFLDGQCALGNAISTNAQTYSKIDKINFVRYNTGFVVDGDNNQIGYSEASNTQAAPYNVTGNYLVATTLSMNGNNASPVFGNAANITTINYYNSNTAALTLNNLDKVGTIGQANNNVGNGLQVSGGSSSDQYVGSVTASNNTSSGVSSSGGRVIIGNVVANNNGASGIVSGSGTSYHELKIFGGSTSGNTTAGITPNSDVIRLRNFTMSDSTPIGTLSTNQNGGVYSENDQNVANTHVITLDGGTIKSATDQRHTASGISWKFSPTDVKRNANRPLTLSVGKVACAANTQVSVTIWTYRDNTNVQGQLRVLGGALVGIGSAGSDVTVSCAPSINTWTQSSTMTFTPTEAGVVELFFDVWDGTGTTNNFWIDDIFISQA